MARGSWQELELQETPRLHSLWPRGAPISVPSFCGGGGVLYLALQLLSYLLRLYLHHSYSYYLFPWLLGFVNIFV